MNKLSIVGIGPGNAENMTLRADRVLREDKQVDMFSTVFIGSQQTKVLAGMKVTPRGYKNV